MFQDLRFTFGLAALFIVIMLATAIILAVFLPSPNQAQRPSTTAAYPAPTPAPIDMGEIGFCPNWRNYVYATKPDTDLDALRALVNDLPGQRLPENNRYLIEEVVGVSAFYLPSTEWQLVVLLYVQDTCDQPGGE